MVGGGGGGAFVEEPPGCGDYRADGCAGQTGVLRGYLEEPEPLCVSY